MEELRKSEVDKKNLVGQPANTQHEIFRFDIKVDIM